MIAQAGEHPVNQCQKRGFVVNHENLLISAGQRGVDEFTWWTLLVAFAGATVLLIALGALDRGSSGRRR